MKRLTTAFICVSTLSGCALFGGGEANTAAAPAYAPASAERIAPTPVTLRAPKVAHGAKAMTRRSAGPRGLTPCFGDSPLDRPCRWDGAIDHENDFDDIRADAESAKSDLIRVGN